MSLNICSMEIRRCWLGRLVIAVYALVSVVSCTGTLQAGTESEERFHFKDGNRPLPHFSRNMLALPLDVTGAALAHDAQSHCAARHVVRGSMHLCDLSPGAALEALQSFRSPLDGRSIFQHVISNYSSVVFPNSQLAGFLDSALVHDAPASSGSVWQYRAEFLSRLDATAFQQYLQNELPSMLKQGFGLRCVVTNDSAPSRVSHEEAQEFSVKVTARLCGGDKSSLAGTVFYHLQASFPSMLSPRTPGQLEANMLATNCEAFDACCCSSPLAVEFVATFGDAAEAIAFEGRQQLVGAEVAAGTCAAVESAEAFLEQSRTTVNMDILLCLQEPVQDFVNELRESVSPIGAVNALDYIRFHYPSVQSITSPAALISTDTVIPQHRRMCADKHSLFCCDNPSVWKLVATFADEAEARGFTHYVTADLTAHMTATAELSQSENFLLPLSKSVSTWSPECSHAIVEEYSPDSILNLSHELSQFPSRPTHDLEAGEVAVLDASRLEMNLALGGRRGVWDHVSGAKRRR